MKAKDNPNNQASNTDKGALAREGTDVIEQQANAERADRGKPPLPESKPTPAPRRRIEPISPAVKPTHS